MPIFILLKKPIAILLLAVYLFNLCGYSLVFRYFIHQSEEQFVQQLDHNKYKENDLLQISIPLHLPYMQNSSGFERIEGSIENNGTQYNYVKRMVHNDTLYIMCLPNNQKTQLVKGKSNYAGQVNDFTSNKKGKESSAKKINLSAEYNSLIPQYSFAIQTVEINGQVNHLKCALHSVNSNTPEHPPKSVC